METVIRYLPAILVVAGIIAIGIRIEKFNHHHITKKDCNKRYVPLLNKTTYVQILLMEIATEEQKEKAEINFKAFDFEKEINGKTHT